MKMHGHISSATQLTATARYPSSDGGWRVVFPPAAGTDAHRRPETTRVAPFAHLHICSFANSSQHPFSIISHTLYPNPCTLTPNPYSLKFPFSAKERDTETGLSYFGARYYSSDLSIWLSVDPMSGKYPSLSPYVYCANNPVKLVDPNGEEVYEFDENGVYLRTSGGVGTPDQIKINYSDGSSAISQEYKNGTISLCEKIDVKQQDGKTVTAYPLKISGDKEAIECFKFVADNTKVEWALMSTGNCKSSFETNYLSNSQELAHESSTLSMIDSYGLSVRSHWHSHPFGTHNPSDDDFYAAAILNNRFKCSSDPVTMPTYIYSHGKSRRYFNKALEPSEQDWKDLFQYINNYKP